MALANSQGHVSIAGKSYILIEESYEKRAQQPFSPRFATGDPSEGDNSFWQFLSQKGWTGEGQEKYDVVTKYRQSAGWDLRDGKRAYLARGIESVTLDAALPDIDNDVSFLIYDDFEGALDTTKWNDNLAAGVYAAATKVVASSRRAYSGVVAGGSGKVIDARGAAGGDHTYNAFIARSDTGIADTGTWQFDLIHDTAGNRIFHGVVFYGNASGSYILEVSGADGIVAKIIKTPNTVIANTWFTNTNDTVLATYVAVSDLNSAQTWKITRDVDGNFEVFQGGASLGTFNDTTYTSTQSFAYAGAHDSNTPRALIDNVYFPGAGSSAGVTSKFINYYNALYTCWDSGGTSFEFTTVRTASQASNLPKIVHQNASDIVIWQRDESPTNNINTYLVSVLGTTLRAYDGETQVLSQSITIVGTCVIPINSTTIAVIGTTSARNGIPAIEIVKFTAKTWTVATQVPLILDGATAGTVAGYASLDSDGALYFATNDLSANLGTQPSRLFYINSTDILATNPTITSSWTLTDFVCRGVFSLQGVVHLFGARKRGTNSYAAIMKSDGTTVYESTKAISLSDTQVEENFFNHGIPSIWKNFDHVIFVGMTDLDLWTPIIQLDSSGNMRECASFAAAQFGTAEPNVIAIAEWNGAFYCLNADAGTVVRTTNTRGSLGADFATCVLQLSDMGGNTSLINKTLTSVIVELSEAMPGSEELTVIVNGTTIGTMAAAGGTRKEITLTAELTASVFTTKLSLLQSSTWTGYVKSVMLKYVPTQFKKRAWGFGIRATKRLKMGDGTHESRTPATMFTDIEAAWSSNVPVTFIDVDGTSYTVLVTDFKQKRPLLSIDRQSGNEAFYFIEVLEI